MVAAARPATLALIKAHNAGWQAARRGESLERNPFKGLAARKAYEKGFSEFVKFKIREVRK